MFNKNVNGEKATFIHNLKTLFTPVFLEEAFIF